MIFFLMIRRPPGSTRTDTLFPYTTLFRSALAWIDQPQTGARVAGDVAVRGWAFKDGASVARVEISVDGVVVAQAQYGLPAPHVRSEEHTSELQSLMRISYAVFCLKKKKKTQTHIHTKI